MSMVPATAPRDDFAVSSYVIGQVAPLTQMAEMYAKGGLVPSALVGNPGAVFTILTAGVELGDQVEHVQVGHPLAVAAVAGSHGLLQLVRINEVDGGVGQHVRVQWRYRNAGTARIEQRQLPGRMMQAR